MMPMVMMPVMVIEVVVIPPTWAGVEADNRRRLDIDDRRRTDDRRRWRRGECAWRGALRRHHDPIADAALLEGDESPRAEIEAAAAAADGADDHLVANAGASHFHEIEIRDGHRRHLRIGLRDYGGSGGGSALVGGVDGIANKSASESSDASADKGASATMIFAADECASHRAESAADDGAGGGVVLVVARRRLIVVLLRVDGRRERADCPQARCGEPQAMKLNVGDHRGNSRRDRREKYLRASMFIGSPNPPQQQVSARTR
jgi:hypothetical protein